MRILLHVVGLTGIILAGVSIASPSSCPPAYQIEDYLKYNFSTCTRITYAYQGYRCPDAYKQFSDWQPTMRGGGIRLRKLDIAGHVFPDLDEGDLTVGGAPDPVPLVPRRRGLTCRYQSIYSPASTPGTGFPVSVEITQSF